MGEAKRREELRLPPRQKKIELNKSDRYLSWLPICLLYTSPRPRDGW